MDRANASVAGEFCHVVDIADIGAAGLTRNIAANDHERAALAERFSLQALDSLEAAIQLTMADDNASVLMQATVSADVVQTCVVTLDPVPVQLRHSFKILFAPVDMDGTDVHVTPDDDHDPEPLDGDTIDIGEVVAQQFGLNLDPYPRRPDVVFSPQEMSDENRTKAEEDAGSSAGESPFAVLRNMKSTT